MPGPVKIPGPDHPITVTPSDAHVVVRAGETVIADTRASLVLQEASYPPVYYVPFADIDRTVLASSDTSTYCPYKGDASYASVTAGEQVIADALWFYEQPFDAVGEIKDHAAFYTDRVALAVEAS